MGAGGGKMDLSIRSPYRLSLIVMVARNLSPRNGIIRDSRSQEKTS